MGAEASTNHHTQSRSRSISHSVSFDTKLKGNEKRKSLPHFADFSMYPDRFDNKNRTRTESTGSDGSSGASSPRGRIESVTTYQNHKQSSIASSAPNRFDFFDYSMILDKDPKSGFKR